MKIFILLFSILLAVTVIAQPGLYQKLDIGNNKVGFREMRLTDYSRTYQGDFRSIQISLWYPVAKHTKGRVNIKDYLALYASEDLTQQIDDSEAFWQKQFSRLNETVDFSSLSTTTAIASYDEPPVAGNYPLVLYAAGGQGESFENFLICEALASQGFVVAAIPSLGTYIHEIEIKPDGLATQTQDLLAVLHHLNQQAYINPQQVGVMGWSWGGLASVYLASRYLPVKAFLSMDGSIAGHETAIEAMPYYSIEKVNDPSLFIATSESTAQRSRAYYEKAIYSPATFMAIDSIDHGDFSVYGYLANIFAREGKDDNIISFYPFLVNTTTQFFKHYLKENKQEVFAPVNICSLVSQQASHPGLDRPLREDELIALIQEEGAEAGVEAYHRMKEENPNLQLFDAFELTKLAFTYARDSVRTAESVHIMEMVLREYPQSASSHALKGRIHEIRGELLPALEHFSIAYGLKPERNSSEEIVFYEDRLWYREKIEALKNKLLEKK